MPDAIRNIEIVDTATDVRKNKIRASLFKVLSFPFPFLWIDMVVNYYKWANKRQRRDLLIYGSAIFFVCLLVVCFYIHTVIGVPGDIAHIAVIALSNIVINAIATYGLRVPDRLPMTFRDEPRLSYREVADSTPNKIVLGATGTGYTKIDWFSEFNRKHLMLYADTDGTGARDYLVYLAWCASAYKKTLLVFCDSGKGSAADFPAALQLDETIVLSSSTQVNKFFQWLHYEFTERYKARASGKMPETRIVIIFDDVTAASLVFAKDENPTLRPVQKYAREIIRDGKSQNIHIIALAPVYLRPANMPSDFSPNFEPIHFYYRLRYHAGDSHIQKTGEEWLTDESPIAYWHETYSGKILDNFALWRNGWVRCKAPYISDDDAGKLIAINLKTNHAATLMLRNDAKNFELYDIEQIETFADRFTEVSNGNLKLKERVE